MSSVGFLSQQNSRVEAQYTSARGWRSSTSQGASFPPRAKGSPLPAVLWAGEGIHDGCPNVNAGTALITLQVKCHCESGLRAGLKLKRSDDQRSEKHYEWSYCIFYFFVFSFSFWSELVVLKLELAWESPEGHVKLQLTSPSPRDSDLVGLGGAREHVFPASFKRCWRCQSRPCPWRSTGLGHGGRQLNEQEGCVAGKFGGHPSAWCLWGSFSPLKSQEYLAQSAFDAFLEWNEHS